MAHVYASVSDFKRYAVDDPTKFGTTSDARLLAGLVAVSASIDEYCERTGRAHAVSGFGPSLGTNRYDGPGGQVLDLDDDLLSITSVSVLASTGDSSSITFTDETDFYKEPYDRSPYRSLILHGNGQPTWYRARRGIAIACKKGYQDVRVTHSSTLGANITTTTATSITLADAEIGWTVLIDSEQLLITAVTGSTCTVVRGANGTTAATHSSGATVERYTYPGPVVEASLMALQRRRKSRDAGLTPDFGGAGGAPITTNRDTERAIFRELLWQYALPRLT